MLLWLSRSGRFVAEMSPKTIKFIRYCGSVAPADSSRRWARGKKTIYATVAQSVEQLIRNQQVAGSSPASSSIYSVLKSYTKKSLQDIVYLVGILPLYCVFDLFLKIKNAFLFDGCIFNFLKKNRIRTDDLVVLSISLRK